MPRRKNSRGHYFKTSSRIRELCSFLGRFGLQALSSYSLFLGLLSRFFASLSPEDSAQWVAEAARPIWGALPDTLILDWDSTVQSKYG
ncbi:MAG: hypothetical protein RLZZ408_225, partial [Verrucomicrobiota bacterium]